MQEIKLCVHTFQAGMLQHFAISFYLLCHRGQNAVVGLLYQGYLDLHGNEG